MKFTKEDVFDKTSLRKSLKNLGGFQVNTRDKQKQRGHKKGKRNTVKE